MTQTFHTALQIRKYTLKQDAISCAIQEIDTVLPHIIPIDVREFSYKSKFTGLVKYIGILGAEGYLLEQNGLWELHCMYGYPTQFSSTKEMLDLLITIKDDY